jgi:hypothetical protein
VNWEDVFMICFMAQTQEYEDGYSQLPASDGSDSQFTGYEPEQGTLRLQTLAGLLQTYVH